MPMATMQDRFSVILPGRLFLGDMTAAINADLMLDQLNVTHVVNASNRTAPNAFADRGVSYLNVDLEDDVGADIKCYLDGACLYIKDALAKPKGVVFVHCMVGVSRSATITVAAMCCLGKEGSSQPMSLREAFDHVKERRPAIRPNPLFAEQLLEWAALRNPDKSAAPDITAEDICGGSLKFYKVGAKAAAARGALDRLGSDGSDSGSSWLVWVVVVAAVVLAAVVL